MPLPPWDKLNIPNYLQIFSFPMGIATMQEPEVSITFWPACLPPAAHSVSFKIAPGALQGAAHPQTVPPEPPLVSSCLKQQQHL